MSVTSKKVSVCVCGWEGVRKGERVTGATSIERSDIHCLYCRGDQACAIKPSQLLAANGSNRQRQRYINTANQRLTNPLLDTS